MPEPVACCDNSIIHMDDRIVAVHLAEAGVNHPDFVMSLE
jgi:hypothetical protein